MIYTCQIYFQQPITVQYMHVTELHSRRADSAGVMAVTSLTLISMLLLTTR